VPLVRVKGGSDHSPDFTTPEATKTDCKSAAAFSVLPFRRSASAPPGVGHEAPTHNIAGRYSCDAASNWGELGLSSPPPQSFHARGAIDGDWCSVSDEQLAKKQGDQMFPLPAVKSTKLRLYRQGDRAGKWTVEEEEYALYTIE
jgi:hypothetical protein